MQQKVHLLDQPTDQPTTGLSSATVESAAATGLSNVVHLGGRGWTRTAQGENWNKYLNFAAFIIYFMRLLLDIKDAPPVGGTEMS